MIEKFNLELSSLNSSLLKRTLREFVLYALENKRPFNFFEFNRNTGINKGQWEEFCTVNKKLPVKWEVEEE